MILKSLNATTLADLFAGAGGREYADINQRFGWEIKQNPALAEMYWFVQAASLRPDGLQKLMAAALAGVELRTQSSFDETLKFLSGEGCDGSRAGKWAPEIQVAIAKQMASHARAIQTTLAATKVSATILKELDLAMRHKVPVPIIGDSRFGKTKALSVWCEMRLGKARLVTVPESNREFDFYAAHASAFGIPYTDRTPTPRLKRAVEWVLHTSRFFVCYDEAHFLVPLNYNKDTTPKRINWVRCQVIDKGIGCAFFATPQSMNQTLERYAATTKYNFEQWLGRLAPPVVLADYYDRDELMAVAKVHFPDFPERLLALICARAMQSEGYLKSMEFTARYASALAQESNRQTPNLQDVEESIERMMPSKAVPQKPTEPIPRRRAGIRLQPSIHSGSDRIAPEASDTSGEEEFTSRNSTIGPIAERPRSPRALVPA